MTKDELLKPVFAEINKLFNNTSVSVETTYEMMEDIIEFTKILALTLSDDVDEDEDEYRERQQFEVRP